MGLKVGGSPSSVGTIARPADEAIEPAEVAATDEAGAPAAPDDGFDSGPRRATSASPDDGFDVSAQPDPGPGGPDAVKPNYTPPPLPAGTYDVKTISDADLKALAASKNPAERAMAATITRAKTAYADRLNEGARILVNTSPANGNKPVLTLIPKGFNYNADATVQTHYHGWNATVADPKGHGAGLSFRMQEVQDADPQHVFILPECQNAQAGDYETKWANVQSQAQTTDDALAAAGIKKVGSRVVSAHSGGGAALASAIDKHADGSGLKADRLELLDCLYGSQVEIETWAHSANGAACGDVTYYHGTNGSKADGPADGRKGLAAAFRGRYHRVNVTTPHPVPTGIGPSGKPVPRFKADPHNTTVGQYA